MIDVMLPFWGRMDHVQATVRSVLAQTDDRWRLVVVDDANPDDSLGPWLDAIGDPRISYTRLAENVGIGANFQKSIDMADATHLVIMGSDDIMLPGYIEWAHDLIGAHPNAAFFHPGSQIIDSDGTVVRTLTDTAKALYRPRVAGPTVFAGERLASNLLRGNWMNFPAITWRSDAIRAFGFDQRYSVVQDLALALDVVEAGGELVLDSRVEFQYRRHAASVSSWRATDGSRFTEEKIFFLERAARYASMGWSVAARSARRHVSSRINALTQIPGALRHGDRSGARVLAAHAFRSHPA
jgi:glycosyltransferase involved in cell wall biosynthesis